MLYKVTLPYTFNPGPACEYTCEEFDGFFTAHLLQFFTAQVGYHCSLKAAMLPTNLAFLIISHSTSLNVKTSYKARNQLIYPP